MDIGLSGDEVRAKVEVGDQITMDRTVEHAGNNIIGKAFDDRICVFQMLEALRQLQGTTNVEIVAVATTQEEVGLRGARTSAHHLEPDIAVALDITLEHRIVHSGDNLVGRALLALVDLVGRRAFAAKPPQLGLPRSTACPPRHNASNVWPQLAMA